MHVLGNGLKTQFTLWALAVLVLCLLRPISAEAACTTADQNSGEHCTSMPSTPWVWFETTYGGYGEHPSLEALIEAIKAKQMSVPSPARCSVTLDSISYDIQSPGYTYPNAPESVSSRRHRLEFSVVRNNATACEVTFHLTMSVLGQRIFVCPVGYTPIYQDSPRIGPHCGISWWKADERKSAGCGGCKTGQIDKGNPIQVGTGNKYQRETDYVGAGRHPLRVQRHYNSILIKNYAPPPFEADPLGPGWSAQYFQRIKYFVSGNLPTALRLPRFRRQYGYVVCRARVERNSNSIGLT